MSATKQQVVAALIEFRSGRKPHIYRACIKGLLRRFGGGVTSVNTLLAIALREREALRDKEVARRKARRPVPQTEGNPRT